MENKTEPKIFIGVPTMGHMKTDLASRLLLWTKQFKGVAHATCGVTPVDHARNEIVRVFMKSDCTHLFFVDADTIPPVDAIKKLLAMDTDIASGITHIYRDGGIVNNCFTDYSTNADGSKMTAVVEDTGIVEIERCGGSCMLIKREVFEKIGEKWFQNIWNEAYTGYISEDLSFCDKARELGFKLKCDTSLVCVHAKELLI